MARITKGMISAAERELECIRELATESGNWDVASASWHARSATNYMAVLVAAGRPLPAWALRDIGFLKAHGWRFDAGWDKRRMCAG